MKSKLKILLVLSTVAVLLLGFAVPVNMVGNWYQQFMPNLNNMPLSDIFFVDSMKGWAVTGNQIANDSNYILKTTNGGDNWQIKHTAYQDFFRVKFINQNTGFVCGGFNSIGNGLLKSVDGGNSWAHVNSPNIIEFKDMFLLNEDTIWLVDNDGLDGGVFCTYNGGASWQQQFSLMNNNPTKIYMYNARLGFISTTANTILRRTTNGGTNWSQITGENGFADMFFADSLTGWKAAGTMKKTTNGGLNWVVQIMPSGGIFSFTGAGKLSGLSKDTIWAVGGNVEYPNLQNRGVIYRTTNGGDNWLFQIPDTSIHLSIYNFVQFSNSKIGWAYASNSGIHTTTGGDPVWLTPVTQISSEIPKEYRLFQNYPNPFNPFTVISYQLRVSSYVKMTVYDIMGKEIAVLVNQKQIPGTYSIDFSGTFYSSGVYFYNLILDDILVDTKKMILIK